MAQRVLQEPADLNYSAGFHATLNSGSQASSAFAGCQGLWIASTKAAYFKTGVNPTAAADGSSAMIPAGWGMMIKITPGDKIAVLQAEAGGEFVATPAR